MRIGFIFLLALLGPSTATLDVAGAASGAASLAANAAQVAAMAKTPATLMFPFVAPGLLLLKLSKLGILKKIPFLAAIAAKKSALMHAKVNMVKGAVSGVYQTKKAILELPLKVGAMTVGAIAGAKAGAEVGLSSFLKLPKPQFMHTVVIPASALLTQTGSSATTAGNAAKAPPTPALDEESTALDQGESTTETSVTTEPPLPDFAEDAPVDDSDAR